MKRIVMLVMFFVLCSFVVSVGFSYSIQYGYDDFNFIFAMRYPAFINQKWADHTYVCINSGGGTSMGMDIECYAYHGGNSDGHMLGGTWGYGDIDATMCIASQDDYCEVKYLYNGVCHQESNRMMWPTKKTVQLAKGYDAFTKLYGVYGTKVLKQNNRWAERQWQLCKMVCPIRSQP